MKIYSDSNVSTTDLQAIQASTEQSLSAIQASIEVSLDEIDQKQNRNIRQLRVAVGLISVVLLGAIGFFGVQLYDLAALLK